MAWPTNPDRYKGVPERLAARIRHRDNHQCQHCGHRDLDGHSLEVDHILNVKAGGTDHPDNLQVLCIPCHRAKTGEESGRARRGRPRNHRAPEKHPGLRW